MSELNELIQLPVRFLAVAAYAMLYSLGGTQGFNKLFRRIGAPVIFAVIMSVVTPIDWRYLSFVALVPPLWLGYGGGENESRVVYACVSGLCGAFVCFVYGSNGMAVFQFILTVFATTYLGVLNPITARKEEALIGAFNVLGISMVV